MSSAMESSSVDPCDPVGAYIDPIRSVLFIDDQFPTFDASEDPMFKEAARARALWRACVDRGWLCDIDNSADWSKPTRQRRLAACDLLVLDFHLDGQDSGPALKIIRDLAQSPDPNMVIVYTKDPDLDRVLLSIAASARGASSAKLDRELDLDIEDLDPEWTQENLLAFLDNQKRWMGTFIEACKAAGLNHSNQEAGEILLERWIHDQYGAGRCLSPMRIEKIQCLKEPGGRWFHCGNLFVTVAGKAKQQEPRAEAEALFEHLEAAVRAWEPPWLACLVAASRRKVEAGSFRDDIQLPPESLQAGLLHFIQRTDDTDEKRRRAHDIATHLLSRRFEYAAEQMAENLLQRKELPPEVSRAGKKELLHLNAFLCSEAPVRHHLSTGSIFRHVEENKYWVCVTPACDMVPRKPGGTNPWAKELDPIRPMLALRLDVQKRKVEKPLEVVERGRFIFFAEQLSDPQKKDPVVAACFHTETDDANPRLEQMFALDRSRVSQGKVRLQRCIAGDGCVSLEEIECRVVAQLRAPYAERLVHVVGGHLSRIGVDFFPLKKAST